MDETLKNARILIVDDQEANIDILHIFLKRQGYLHIKTTTDSREVDLLFSSFNPELILLDLYMPFLTGFEVMEQLKSRIPSNIYLPILVLTADVTSEAKQKALAVGANDFLTKPFDLIEVGLRIRNLLYTSYLQQQQQQQNLLLERRVQERTVDLENTNKALTIAKDIAEENEIKYKQLFDNTSDHIFILNVTEDQRFKVLAVNPIQEKEIGQLRVDNYIEDCFSEDVYNKVVKNYRRCLSEKEILIFEEELFDLDFVTQLIPVKNSSGQVGRIIGIARNITHEKALTNQLVSQNEELKALNAELIITKEKAEERELHIRQIANNLSTGVIYQMVMSVDGKRQITYISDTVKNLYGCTPEEIKADSNLLFNRFHRDDLERFIQEEKEAIKNMSTFKTEVRVLNPNEEFRWSYFISNPRLYKEMIYWDGIEIDITDQKKNEQELIAAKDKAEESDRLKTAFLHNISHEVRTPMNAIVGFSRIITKPNINPQKRDNFIELINKSCDQLLSIISDIISIATIEAGQEKINKNEIDINAALKQLYDTFSATAKKQNISLNLISVNPDSENKIVTDGAKIIQILTYLIGNALKFTKKGHVNFGYRTKGLEIEFFVEDTGIGIPSHMYEEIFIRFRQVESATARSYGGSGLGLSISKAYVEMLGGKIWLKSELEKGSTFYFTIPYESTAKISVLKPESSKEFNIDNKLRTILIAEDEESNFVLIEELLADLNINIIRAINGLEAVELCKSNKNIDLVLMDIKMPVMDGYEATKLIKEILPNLPIIAQTAYSTNDDKNKALSYGCVDFISKPINREKLLAIIMKQFH